MKFEIKLEKPVPIIVQRGTSKKEYIRARSISLHEDGTVDIVGSYKDETKVCSISLDAKAKVVEAPPDVLESIKELQGLLQRLKDSGSKQKTEPCNKRRFTHDPSIDKVDFAHFC